MSQLLPFITLKQELSKAVGNVVTDAATIRDLTDQITNPKEQTCLMGGPGFDAILKALSEYCVTAKKDLEALEQIIAQNNNKNCAKS